MSKVMIDYTNWRGVRGIRKIEPIRIYYGSNEFHPLEQWLLLAVDLDKNEERTFSMCNIHDWEEL